MITNAIGDHMNVTSLFGIPLYFDKLNYNVVSDLETIDNLKYDIIEEGNFKISKNTKLLHNVEFQSLKNLIDKKINFYTKEILKVDQKINFFITTSWIVKFSKESFSNKHTHSNSIFSGIVYLKTPKNCNRIRFYKDNRFHNISYPTLELNYTESNIFNSDYWEYSPSEGDIYIFPSNLTHSVEKSMFEDTRISLAFNVYASGEFGIHESKLII